MTDYKHLIQQIESFQKLLMAMATGGESNDTAYRDGRDSLVNNPILSDQLPPFVHDYRDCNQFRHFIKKKYPTYDDRYEYLRIQFSKVIADIEKLNRAQSAIQSQDLLLIVDSPHVVDAWKKAFIRSDKDPSGAITSARSLLESVCKFILDKAGEPYSDSIELPRLYKETAKKLNLAPDQHGEQVFKQILGGIQTVVEGLGAMRNKLSDAHGRSSRQVKPKARHAALAVNLAGSMASFLIKTYEDKGIKNP